ncbi:MAG: nucleotide exchange factor GrpE [Armatimonadetes bacterium]|nr:nucleotide exchange factor GrpE [Armatimonadota bacterium]
MSEWLQQHQDALRQRVAEDLKRATLQQSEIEIPRSTWPVYEKYKRLKRQADGLETQFNDAWLSEEVVRRLIGRGDVSAKGLYGLHELLPTLEQDRIELESQLSIARHRMRASQWEFQALVRGGADPWGSDSEGYTLEPESTMLNEGKTVPESPAQPDPATADASVATPAVDAKDAQIAELTNERDALKDQLLRAMAEAQNVQRRLRQQMDESRRFASQPLVEKLLPVLDSFERSVAAAEKGSSVEALLEGVRAVERQLRAALETVEVKRIESVGKPYDPEYHEALVALETDEHAEDTVLDEIEAGYTMHGRVVRPAKVRVAKKP